MEMVRSHIRPSENIPAIKTTGVKPQNFMIFPKFQRLKKGSVGRVYTSTKRIL